MRLADRVILHSAPEAPSALSELQLWFKALARPKKTSLRFALPDVSGVIGLLLSAGLPVSVAIGWLAPRTNGEVGRLLRDLAANLELGAELLAELDELSRYGDPGLTELAEKLKRRIEGDGESYAGQAPGMIGESYAGQAPGMIMLGRPLG